MKYAFHPEAEAEFFDAIGYYEECEPGLGYDFAIELHSTIQTILSFPRAWTILKDDIRRCQTRRFSRRLPRRFAPRNDGPGLFTNPSNINNGHGVTR
jgi:hypothetical protein